MVGFPVVPFPGRVLHEERVPFVSPEGLLSSPASGVVIASLSDLLRSPFRGRNRKSFGFASLSDLLSSPLRGSHLLRPPPEERVPSAAGGACSLVVFQIRFKK